MTPPRTRVVLIEDDRALCQRVERVLLRAAHAVLVATCFDAESATKSLIDEQLRADVVLIDSRLDAVALICRLTAERADVTTVVLAHAEDDPTIFRALRVGAAGYLIATEDLGALRDRVVVLLHGGAHMTPAIATQVLELRLSLVAEELAVLERIVNDGERKPADPNVIREIYRKLGASSRSDSVRELFRRRNS